MSRRGFTLLETLVAMAILGLGLAALYPVFGAMLDRDAQAQSAATAASLARSLAARLDVDLPLALGTSAGNFADGYRWTMKIQPYGGDEDRSAWPLRPYEIETSVFWPAGGAERSLTLTTLRLAPKGSTP
jgi:prepilin-type N-terminal cleavage/methylation domain-containing protein